METYNLIKYKFELGVYTLEDMCKFVKNKQLTRDEFHFITSYNYDAIKDEKRNG